MSEIKESKDTINQYTPIDEDEHKEVDRKANLNSARVFLYQGIGGAEFLKQLLMLQESTNHGVSWKGEEECNKNMETFINCIDAVRGENSIDLYDTYLQLNFDSVNQIIYICKWILML